MRTALLAAAATLGLCTCLQATAFQSTALADDAAASAFTAAERRKIFAEAGYTADSSGKVENVCGEKVTPKLASADVGGAVGVAAVLLVPNGTADAGCYEDAGDMYLMRREGSGFSIVYADFGRIAVLPTFGADGVRDIALFKKGATSGPAFRWRNGGYGSAGRNVTKAATDGAPLLP